MQGTRKNDKVKLNKEALYPLYDIGPGKDVRAQWTGEFRPPKAGEWYLSGAIIEAYEARSDMLYSYYIARLVRTKTVTTTVAIGPW